MKCDSQQPCWQCKRKGILCLYTREGYHDPYNSFRLRPSEDISKTISKASQQDGAFQSLVTVDDSATSMWGSIQPNALDLPEDNSTAQPNMHALGDSLFATANQAASSYSTQTQTSRAFAGSHETQWMPTDFDFESMMDFTFESYPNLFQQGGVVETNVQDSIFPHVSSLGGENGLLHHDDHGGVSENPAEVGASTASQLVHHDLSKQAPPESGFAIAQLDPVEAKCLEVKALLEESLTFAKDDDALSYINRENLVLCVGLYGKHFQPNLPDIHIPTFTLTETPPSLLLALMLVGACYSERALPRAIIEKLAMRLLHSIGNRTVSLLMIKSLP